MNVPILTQSNQGSEEWSRERAGHATASCFGDILAVSKRDGKPLKARHDYLMKLVCERLTGDPVESPGSYSMDWGKKAEPFARKEYELQTGSIVMEIDFRKHREIKWVGSSIDGLVGTKGGIEIKSPSNSCIHLLTIESGMPDEHIPQTQGNIWVHDLDWIDFISYDPRLRDELKIYIQRIYRDQKYIDMLQNEVLKFLNEVQAKVDFFLQKAA